MAYVHDIVDNIVKCDDYTTPQEVFNDIKSFKPQGCIKIYDPFYNDGKSKEYLQKTFSDCEIIHENKDAFSWLPDFDIIITNPPFSLKNKILIWLMEIDKPFIILLPINQICNKSYRNLKNFDKIQYVIPNGRYNFEVDGKKLKSNWFNCLWYCYKCSLSKDINFIS